MHCDDFGASHKPVNGRKPSRCPAALAPAFRGYLKYSVRVLPKIGEETEGRTNGLHIHRWLTSNSSLVSLSSRKNRLKLFITLLALVSMKVRNRFFSFSNLSVLSCCSAVNCFRNLPPNIPRVKKLNDITRRTTSSTDYHTSHPGPRRRHRNDRQ